MQLRVAIMVAVVFCSTAFPKSAAHTAKITSSPGQTSGTGGTLRRPGRRRARAPSPSCSRPLPSATSPDPRRRSPAPKKERETQRIFEKPVRQRIVGPGDKRIASINMSANIFTECLTDFWRSVLVHRMVFIFSFLEAHLLFS